MNQVVEELNVAKDICRSHVDARQTAVHRKSEHPWTRPSDATTVLP